MKKLSIVLLLLLISTSVLAACGGSGDSSEPAATESTEGSGEAAASTGEVKEITVNASNFQFDPSEIHVNEGDTVKITLSNKEGAHGLSIPAFNVNITGDQSAEFVADKAGEYDFACSVFCGAGHGEMTGKLIVE